MEDKYTSQLEEHIKNIDKALEWTEQWMRNHDVNEKQTWEKVTSHMIHTEESLKKLNLVHEKLFGNGQPGLLVRMDRVERSVSAATKISWAAAFAVVVVFIKALLGTLGVTVF